MIKLFEEFEQTLFEAKVKGLDTEQTQASLTWEDFSRITRKLDKIANEYKKEIKAAKNKAADKFYDFDKIMKRYMPAIVDVFDKEGLRLDVNSKKEKDYYHWDYDVYFGDTLLADAFTILFIRTDDPFSARYVDHIVLSCPR